MSKFLFLCFFIVIGYCNCKIIPLTNKDIDDGFTIVLPRQEKYSLLQCSLQFAKKGDTKSDFYPAIDIKKTKKNRHGIEYVPNYYQTGDDDSCTFRVYPNILKQFSDVYQMRYWEITMKNLIQEAVVNLGQEEEWETKASLFYMNSWSWWTEQHVNTVILRLANPFVPRDQFLIFDCQYLYVDRKVENAFTIVLPREEKSLQLLCFLRIAVNGTTTEEFFSNEGKDIREYNKHGNGTEYVKNYYNSGEDDSCTFRIYPEILDKLSNGHDKYQMRYWKITTWVSGIGSFEKKEFGFYMNSWSTWKNYYHANTLELKKGSSNNNATCNYRYI